MNEEVQLGQFYTDVLSGFRGKAISRCVHLYDATQIQLASEDLDKDGKPVLSWFTEGQLRLLHN